MTGTWGRIHVVWQPVSITAVTSSLWNVRWVREKAGWCLGSTVEADDFGDEGF